MRTAAPARTDTARLFHALSDPTRLRVVELLRHGERCVCDLTEAAEAAQSRLSFHLKVLKDAGLVSDRREGRWIYYQLRPEALESLGAVLASLEPHPPSARRRGCCA
ncbi:MAG TPA: metalloregulator ArsR/SmtB family transcription factor [Gemmatimonadales bacterium]|nr:metalloregulator ArsR/SmtB family transcription factor [Gemmatimonadales bacterium]